MPQTNHVWFSLNLSVFKDWKEVEVKSNDTGEVGVLYFFCRDISLMRETEPLKVLALLP